MGEYYLLPEPHGARFTAEALTEMRTWLDAKPTYRRSDGVILLCRDYAYRDSVLRNGHQDVLSASVEAIRLAPEQVELSILGCREIAPTIRDFVVQCQSRWPCTFVDASLKPLTADGYVEIVIAMNHGY